jgi:hypothetical protein
MRANIISLEKARDMIGKIHRHLFPNVVLPLPPRVMYAESGCWDCYKDQTIYIPKPDIFEDGNLDLPSIEDPQDRLLHEYAHFLDRGLSNHGEVFVKNLILVAGAWYGDPRKYPWGNEYQPVRKGAWKYTAGIGTDNPRTNPTKRRARLIEAGRLGGRVTSPAKAAASRANGRRGGRPILKD